MKKKSSSSSAFFNPRVIIAVVLGGTGIMLSFFAAGLFAIGAPKVARVSPPTAAPVTAPAVATVQGNVIVVQSSKNDVSPPLTEIGISNRPLNLSLECEVKENPPTGIPHQDAPDGALQELEAPRLALQKPQPSVLATVNLNFEGIDFPGVVCSCNPPDTDGAVGLTQYVQEVNEGLQVFNKSTGASEMGPIAVASIWKGFGTVCETAAAGDIVVLYDHFANRWLVSQFAIGASGTVPSHQCIAISTSPDATGSYYRYDFDMTAFGNNYYDYPKIGIWPDAYYMSDNVFNSAGTSFLGPQPFAFNRANMLVGSAATVISPIASPISGGTPMLPADIDGMTLPPSGAPETYIAFPSSGSYKVFHFHVDFGTPSNSTWTTFATPAAASFTQLCTSGRSCIPQAGVSISGAANSATANGLDGIGDRFMFRAAYRNLGTQASPQESLVSNYTVCATGTNCGNGTTTPYSGTAQSGVRWFELLNVTNGTVTLNQESTYNNGGADTLWRWMGSIAEDNAGDMLLGFSTSAGTTGTAYPAIHYAGRLSTDTLNSMAQGEATIFSGAGSQSTSGNRWGDYSAMTVDPEDDCTFWYTQEYYPAGPSTFNWHTRIASISPFSTCTPITAPPVPSIAVYNVADNTSINPGANLGFTVTVINNGTGTANGLSFSDPLPSGTGINWSINTQSGDNSFSISGSPPTQSLVYSPTSLAAGTNSYAHITSSTTSAICGSNSLSHTAMITSTNAGTGFQTASESIDCTNCTPNAWTDNSPQAAAPVAIYDQAMASIGSTVYMFGGFQGNTAGVYGTGAWSFNGTTWTALASLTAANERDAAAAASDGSRYIYIIGGLNSANTAQSTNIIYDTVGNTYTTGTTSALHTAYHAGAVYFNGNVYYMGGFTTSAQTTASTNVDIYNVSANTWSAGAAMPVGLGYNTQVAYINVGGTDYIYAAGGLIVGGTAQSTVYRYNITGNSWSTVSGAMPTSIWGSPNGVVNGYWVFGGGEVNNAVSNAVYSYNPTSNTWTLNASSMQQPRYRGFGAVIGNTLYAVGGRDPSLNPQADNQAYTPSLCAPGLVSAVSRMTHSAAGTFDLALSLTGCSGGSGMPFTGTTEPRNGNGNGLIVFNYAVPVNSGTASAMGATAGSPTFSGTTMTVPVSGVNDQSIVYVTANGVSGPGYGSTTSTIPVGFLIGDVNGDYMVNVGDTAAVRAQAGVTLNSTNFQFDVNLDGFVNVGDTIVVRNKSGDAIPAVCP